MTLDEAFQLAVAHHQAGRLAEAEPLYRQILSAAPDQPDTLHNLAVLYLRANYANHALPLFERLRSRGVDTAAVHNGLAAAYRLLGDPARAADAARRAIALEADFVAAHLTLALALIDLGRLEEVIPVWEALARLEPANASHHSNLGTTYERLGRLADAEAAHRRAVAVDPGYAPAHNNLGAALAHQGRLVEALDAHRAAIAADPTFARAYVNLAHTAQLAGRLDEALAAAAKAVELMPEDVDARRNLAAALQEAGDLSAAAQSYDRAIALLAPAAPKSAAARELRARLRLAAATLLPPIYESADDLLAWRTRLAENFAALARDHIRADLTDEPVPTLFPLAYQGFNDRDLMAQYAGLLFAPQPVTSRGGRTAGRIHVGFISRFFRDHTIGRLNLGLVQHLNRDQFHVTVFSVGDAGDATAAAFKQVADTYVVLPPQLPAARRLVLDQHPDILFYPDLGMDPVTWALAFSRLAPVQCTTWGHPVTTGIPTVDYFLSAGSLDPPGNESHYTERLVRLDHLPVYYHRPTPLASPRSKQPFGLDESWRLYGCLQMLWKFHPGFDPMLAEVLRRDPKGRLLLIKALDPRWDGRLLDRWRRAMPDVTDRVIFVPRMTREDYLALASLCDVSLDPPIFCGGNTTYESLSVGTPVVTLPAPFLRGRLTHAMYASLDFPDCTATSEADYVAKATTIATDSTLRYQIRARLADVTPKLYHNLEAVRELESFFLSAARPDWRRP